MHYIPILFSFLLSQLLQSLNAVNLIPPTHLVQECHSDFTGATHSLYLFDNDGVLKPAEASASSHELRRARAILEELAANPKNEVWVISGRSLSNLQNQYSNIPRLNLAGQLGGEVQKYGEPVVNNYQDLAPPTLAMGDELMQIARRFDAGQDLLIRPSGSIIFQHGGKKSRYVTTMLAEMEQRAAHSMEFTYANFGKFATLTHVECSKGKLAADLLQKHTHPNYFVMAFGDAQIDEPMFQALAQHSYYYGGGKAVSVLVGSADGIHADHRLENHHAVYDFFHNLLG